MTREGERSRIQRWSSGELDPSFLEAWKDAKPGTRAFDAFFTDVLTHLHVHPGECLRAMQRVRPEDVAPLAPADRAAFTRLLAHSHYVVGHIAEAERLYRAAWNEFERLGLTREMASTGMNFGVILAQRGHLERGLKVLRRAHRSIRPHAPEDKLSRARIRVLMGVAHVYGGRITAGLREMKEAESDLLREGFAFDAGVAAFNQGSTLTDWGRLKEAREALVRAVRFIYPEKPKTIVGLRAMCFLAAIDRMEGRESEYASAFERSLSAIAEQGDRHMFAALHMQQAQFLAAAGATGEAEDWARRAQRLWKELGYDRGLARNGNLLARLALRRGDLESARRQFGASLQLYERSGFPILAAQTRLDIAEMHLEDGRVDDARSTLEACRRKLQGQAVRESWVRWLHLRARCDQQQGKHRAALRRLEKARQLSSRVPERWERPWIELTAARAALGSDDHDGTLRWARRAVDSLEEMDLRLGSRHVRESIAPTREDVSRGAMDIVLRRGGPHANRIALDFLSRSRSVQLVEDMLRGHEIDAALRASIARVRADLRAPAEQQSASALATQLESQLESLNRRLERSFRTGSALVRKAIDARSLGSWRRSLGDRTLVFYDVDQEHPLAWVVRQRGTVRRVELPDQARRVYSDWTSVRMLLDYVAHQDPRRRPAALAEAEPEMNANLAALKRTLWDPLDLSPGEVVIVPSESMLELPLEASLVETEDWTVTRLPHPALLRPAGAVRRGGRPRALLLHDGARGQRGELDVVGRLLRREGLQVQRARRRADFETLEGRFDVLHVAAHGAYDRRQWVGNGVKLADGWVGFEQLRPSNVRDALLFFSSCESALPSRAPCSSLDGWMTAGLGAGAREMVLTHWKIDDEAARIFSRRFYAEWTGRRSAAQAAARTRRKLHGEGVHPFRWAPFITVG